MKKILVGFAVIAASAALLPMFAAFEAHVVNVTATIENALSVPVSEIKFGTVFPQEHLNQPLQVSLSQSFIDENRVDDVDYIIRQKPKCGITTTKGTILADGSTVTGHVFPGTPNPADPTHTYYQNSNLDHPESNYYVDCGVKPVLTTDQAFGMLPMLCPYISKHPDTDVLNDGSLDSFHEPFQVTQTALNGPVINWNDTLGHLAKSQNDKVDNWTIDLAVPCFGGQCAQDWASFVTGINPGADPKDYVQPADNEHKVFGCDLWVEVGGISLPGLGCKGKIDLMLVVDRSGSITQPVMDTQVKPALNAFVNALVISSSTSHGGETSFAEIGILDQPLTDNPTLLHNAINALVSIGSTNLLSGITIGENELEGVNNRLDAPNYMVIVTDGQPNSGSPDPAGDALAAANAAKAAGTEIYVVGVGSGVNQAYLETIATNPAHYFSAADFSQLQQKLVDIATCHQST